MVLEMSSVAPECPRVQFVLASTGKTISGVAELLALGPAAASRAAGQPLLPGWGVLPWRGGRLLPVGGRRLLPGR